MSDCPVLTKGLEGIGDIHRIALFITHRGTVKVTNTCLNRPAIDYDSGTIMADCCHQTARHILIASRNGDITVVVLSLAYRTPIKSFLATQTGKMTDHYDLKQDDKKPICNH